MDKLAKVIIADDVAANRVALRSLLRGEPLDLLEADSGNAVLMLALKHSDAALILLDVQMPGMDGYEAAELLRGEERTRHIPIIFLTALSHGEENALRGYSAGGIDYIQKPLVPEILQAKVSLFVELWRVNQKLLAEIHYRREAEKEINHMAMHDQLTQLPNRAQLQKNLELGIARVDRYGGQLAVIFMDLDGFKPINDIYSHEAGDYVLKVLAERLSNMMRPTDTVARFGGDEFVIVMTDLVNVDDIKPKLRSIIEATAEEIIWQGESLLLGSSLGVSLYPGHGKDCNQLVKCADKAMYAAKNSGKGRYCFYETSLQSSMTELYNNRMLSGLNSAIENNELEIHYQPIVDGETYQVIAVEALLRWHSAEFGEVAPLAFIPLAEDNEIITEIEIWALRQALLDSIHWWQCTGQKIKVMVNVSGNHLGGNKVKDNIDLLLQNSAELLPDSISAENVSDFIGLEIPESSLGHAFNVASTALDSIHSQGFGISIDNFGDQGLGLKFLNSNLVSTIKIGKAIIQQLVYSEDKRKLVEAICSMAHIFGFKVIALGVETEQQLQQVQKLQCDFVQGFYFSQPLSSACLLKYMDKSLKNRDVMV